MIFSLFCTAKTLSTTVELSGTLNTDTTWLASDTILITDSVTIAPATQLTILAGTVIMFGSNANIKIDGALIAAGTELRRIVFTARADTVGGLPLAGSWYGLLFRESGHGNLNYCDLSYGMNNIHVFKASLEIHKCIIENFSGNGVFTDGYVSALPISIYIDSSIIRQSDPTLQGTATGIYSYRNVDLTISNSLINSCSFGVYFLGSGTIVPHFQILGCDIRDHGIGGIYAISGG